MIQLTVLSRLKSHSGVKEIENDATSGSKVWHRSTSVGWDDTQNSLFYRVGIVSEGQLIMYRLFPSIPYRSHESPDLYTVFNSHCKSYVSLVQLVDNTRQGLNSLNLRWTPFQLSVHALKSSHTLYDLQFYLTIPSWFLTVESPTSSHFSAEPFPLRTRFRTSHKIRTLYHIDFSVPVQRHTVQSPRTRKTTGRSIYCSNSAPSTQPSPFGSLSSRVPSRP